MRPVALRTVARLAPLVLLAGLAALVRGHWQLPYPDTRWAYADHYRYIAMAEQPFSSSSPLAHEPPFCWRILTPLVVHLLPLPTLDGFWLVTLVGLAGTVLALQWALRGLGLPTGAVAAGGLVLVLLGPATGFDLWAYQLVDPLALCLTTLMIGSAIHRRGGLLLPLAILGALTKETTLLGPLFALAWSYSERDRRRQWWSALALLAAVGVLAALHLLIVPSRPYSILGEATQVYLPFLPVAFTRWTPLALAFHIALRPVAATVGAWGALFPLALLQVWHAPRVWRKYPAFVVLIGAATAQILISWDVERVVIYAFPVVIATSAFEIEHLAQRWRCSRWVLWLPVLAIETFFWVSFAGWSVLARNPGTYWPLDDPLRLVASVFLLSTAGIVIWLRWKLRGLRGAPGLKIGYETTEK